MIHTAMAARAGAGRCPEREGTRGGPWSGIHRGGASAACRWRCR
ncbi:hypothetical protein [Lysobacter gummosus]